MQNQVDSEVMIASLEGAGLTWSEFPEEADIILVNTCGFIAEAKEESIETTLAIREKYPSKQVVMVGCLVRRYENNLKQELNEIDAFWSGTDPAAISKILPDLHGLWEQPAAAEIKTKSHKRGKGEVQYPLFERKRLLSFPGSAYVKIAEGCSNNCSYCAIPLIRGTLRSRERRSVAREIKEFIGRGIFEINIIAQDLASFGVDRGSPELELLLNDISAVEGEFWIRLLYIHPDHFPRSLLSIIRDDPRILPYFDLPFQHASPAILRSMGRKGSKEDSIAVLRQHDNVRILT
ncbi:Ribosomal protein S12 methylthiotransferase RimO [subsurface metagenome]